MRESRWCTRVKRSAGTMTAAGRAGLQAGAVAGAEPLRQLQCRVHLPVADGRHLLAVRLRRRRGRPALHLADADRRRRHVLRRAGLRRARQPLPGRRRALPVLASTPSAPAMAGGWAGSTASRCWSLSPRSTPASCLTSRRCRTTGSTRASIRPTTRRSCSITLALLAVQTTLNIIGRQDDGPRRELGTYVEIVGTFGIAIILAIAASTTGSVSCSPRKARSTPRPTR